MKDFIEIYENALPDDICDSLINEFEYLDSIGLTNVGQVCSKREVRPHIKSSKDICILKTIGIPEP